VVNFNVLKDTTWWKQNGTSLVLLPEAIIEDIEIRKLKKKSLELAGVV
jgi:homoserine dehydrogenase